MADQEVLRRILSEVERDPAISQRSLAEEIGISVGLINWHIKRCVSKGLIKLGQVPTHRYLYYLTPAGFSEKAELTTRYLKVSFDIFRLGREQYGALIGQCRDHGWRRIVLIGHTELTELALMVAGGFSEIKVVGIINGTTPVTSRGAIPVFAAPQMLKHKTADKVDAAIVCHFLAPSEQTIDHGMIITSLGLDQTRLLTPEFLA
ncbi:winged helix-turn-helix transcriptional regulator [Roseibium sediminis]|uniref:winged helix-turn-helix transcriptional regulator n=1 Tax=Roseibium sediminis TaxID=1775174 RepID=UPI00123D9C8F|nr:winged helix-turn-helix transcriptional regulator [Roseibium sediminis]